LVSEKGKGGGGWNGSGKIFKISFVDLGEVKRYWVGRRRKKTGVCLGKRKYCGLRGGGIDGQCSISSREEMGISRGGIFWQALEVWGLFFLSSGGEFARFYERKGGLEKSQQQREERDIGRQNGINAFQVKKTVKIHRQKKKPSFTIPSREGGRRILLCWGRKKSVKSRKLKFRTKKNRKDRK